MRRIEMFSVIFFVEEELLLFFCGHLDSNTNNFEKLLERLILVAFDLLDEYLHLFLDLLIRSSDLIYFRKALLKVNLVLKQICSDVVLLHQPE